MQKRFSEILLSIFLLIASFNSKAQCLEFYDGTAQLTDTPVWISCFGTDFTLNLQSPNNIGAYTVDWGDGSPIDNGASLIPPAFISHIYTATIDTFSVTFTEIGTGCIIAGVVIMEEPTNASIQIPVGGVTQACAPAFLDFINSSTDVSPTTTFTWDFGDGSPILTLDHTNAGQTISHQYLPGTVNCNTQVTLTSENFCNAQQGGPSVATFNPIQIWDIDDASIAADNVLLCYPDTTVTFTNTTDQNCFAQGNTFQRQEKWNFGDYWGVGSDSIIGWQPWPPSLPQTMHYPGIGTYDVMLVDSSYCGLDTAYITVAIVPPPTADFTISDDTICAGEAITMFNNSFGGANTFDWNYGDGTGWHATGAGNQSNTFNVAGDYVITLAAHINGGTASCTDTTTLNLHVLPSPTANILQDNNAGCDTLTVTFTDASVDAISWYWNFDNGFTSSNQNPPPQFYNLVGTYNATLTVTSLNGCVDTDNAQVNVFQNPIVSFSPTSVCQNELAQFSDNSISSPTDPIISWNWSFDDGNTSVLEDPTNVYTALGTYNVSLEVFTANCSASDTIPVVVEPIPTSGFTTSINSGCTPLSVEFTNTTVGAISYNWYFGDGATSTSTDPTHIFVNSATTDTIYNVMLVSSTAFGCTDTLIVPITVFAGANANFSHNGFPGCAPLDVDFTNSSTGATSYQWSFGDGNGSTQTDPSHQYINNTLFIDVYTVELVAFSPNGCSDTLTDDITVYPIPNFGFTSVPDSGCSPLNVSFPSVIGAVAYDWDFGDGTTGSGPTPVHLYSNSTTNDIVYTVRLIATSAFGCIDTSYGTATVFPNPTAQLSLISNTGCTPFNADIQNLSLGATSYIFNYGDGNSSTTTNASHNYLYTNSGTGSHFFDLELIASTNKGCTDTVVTSIEVYPEVISSFLTDTIGCAPLTVAPNHNCINSSGFEWDFGNGIIDFGNAPSYTYQNTTTGILNYNLSLIAISPDGCTDSSNQLITVYPEPVATFNVTPLTQTYPSTTVNMINNTQSGPWNYYWDFGDGDTSTVISPNLHTYSTWGVYNILLSVSTPYCNDTTLKTITINPPLPIPEFTGSGEGCSPLTVTFNNTSQYADTYFWQFGDGNTSIQENPSHTYYGAGNFAVTLTTTGPGGTVALVQYDSVIVHENAVAFFKHAPDFVYVPNQPIQFYNLSSFANEYWWDFGDGDTSVAFTPVHYYTEAGSFDVTLVASNEFGCIDTFTVINAVIAEEGGDVVFPNAFTPDESGGNGGYYDPQALDNNIFFPIMGGVDEYHLMIFNRWGELIFESFDPLIGWDGYYRGELSKQDVYVYKAKVKFSDGRVETKVGDVTLIR